MANALAVALHASGAEAASGNGTAVDIGLLRSCLKLSLQVDAISGTGASLTVHIESAPSATGPWQIVQSFPGLTVASSKRQIFADCLQFVRARWVIAGATPSVTFTVSGAAHVLYAKVADVGTHAIPATAISSVSAAEQAALCLAATDEADGYLGGGKTLPLAAWGDDLTAQVANIAAFKIMKRRGFQPDGSDELIVKGRDDAVSWLRGVARGDIEPPGLVDSTPEEYEPGISVSSDSPTNSGGQYW